MASYRLDIRASAAAELEKVASRGMRRLVVDRILALGDEPRPAGCEKLVGGSGYRVRQGDYRIVYEVDDSARVVRVVKIGHRRDVYRRRR